MTTSKSFQSTLRKQILVCDDDPLFRKTLTLLLRDFGEVTAVQNTDEVLNLLRTKTFDLLFLDVQMRTPEEGLTALPKVRELANDLSIVMLSGLKDFQIVRQAMKNGADDYLVKDFEPEEFKLTVERTLGIRRLVISNQKRNAETLRNEKKFRLIGENKKMLEVKRLIEKFKISNANVLIQGETGTGKEIVARLLRKTDAEGNLEPFVAIDSATLHAQTAESILFGHERGAFTGADSTRKGLFEEADGGVIFFDEIANMPLAIQAKLLRILQEKEVVRMGSSRSIPIDFRVITATNRSLEEMATRGEFLHDLLQRLNVLPVELPPLRDRLEDLSQLTDYFLKEKSEGKVQITSDVLEAFSQYDWPGNVRELSTLLDYSLAMTEDSKIDLSNLHPKVLNPVKKTSPEGGGFYEQVAAFEKNILMNSYKKFEGNVSKMALELGVDRSHLHTKLKLYGIHATRNSI